MGVTLVLTEHAGGLTPDVLRRYAAVRDRLAAVAGVEVTSVPYEGLEDLAGADAVVLSGSYAPWAAHAQPALDRLGEIVRRYDGPVLGICAGMQLQALFAGGSVRHSPSGPENGFAPIEVLEPDGLLEGLPERVEVWEHHDDEIDALPAGFRVLARSRACAVEALVAPERRWWGTQFHPEEWDAEHPAGERILRNFFALALS